MYKLLSSIIVLLLVGGLNLNAQIEKSGTKTVGISDKAQIEEMMLIMEEIGSSSKELLREQSLKSYMMPNRKSLNAERSNAYVVVTCLEYYLNFNSNLKVNLSPDYLVLQKGNAFKDILNGIVLDGTVNAALFPYGSNLLNEAANSTKKYNAENYLHLFRSDIGGRQKIFELRKAIMRGNPVMVDLKVDPSFMDLSNTGSWSFSGKAFDVLQPVIVTGYSEEKKAFEVTGMYGNDWARDGYVWIPYDEMGKLAQNGYVLVVQR